MVLTVTQRFGLFEVNPETGDRSPTVKVFETQTAAEAAAQESVGNAEITWVYGLSGYAFGQIRDKTCFMIAPGKHVIISQPVKVGNITLPWSVNKEGFQPDEGNSHTD